MDSRDQLPWALPTWSSESGACGVPAPHILHPERVPSACLTASTVILGGMRPASEAQGAPRPKDNASGVMAHSCNSRGSKESHASLRPTQPGKGIRGTASLALPTRAAHQDTETAIANASGAVYSASSAEGYQRSLPCCCGSHSVSLCIWWHCRGGQAAISSMLWRKRCLLYRAPPQQQAS